MTDISLSTAPDGGSLETYGTCDLAENTCYYIDITADNKVYSVYKNSDDLTGKTGATKDSTYEVFPKL